MKINNVRGDLSDVSAKTASLVKIHNRSHLFPFQVLTQSSMNNVKRTVWPITSPFDSLLMRIQKTAPYSQTGLRPGGILPPKPASGQKPIQIVRVMTPTASPPCCFPRYVNNVHCNHVTIVFFWVYPSVCGPMFEATEQVSSAKFPDGQWSFCSRTRPTYLSGNL